MKLKSMGIALVVIVLFSGSSFTMAATSFKCGNTFIKEGTHSIAVLKSCGEPRQKEVIGSGGKSGKGVERWTYGPRGGYFYLLIFKGGVLEKIESIRQ